MNRQQPSPLLRPTRLALLLAVTYPCPGWTDDALTLDPVVVTGSRVEERAFDLPAAIAVVGEAQIKADQARVNASEALAGVPGVSVANRQNYAQDLQISTRGFGARSAFGVRGVRLVADGIPASMPDGQGQAATFNLDRAERLEVMRGPMSAVYGNSAGGVIQLFTRDGQGRPSVEGGFSAGSYGSWKADLAADGKTGGVGYVLDASRFATEGYRDHSRAERDQLMAKLSLAPSDDGKLTLVATNRLDKPIRRAAWQVAIFDRAGAVQSLPILDFGGLIPGKTKVALFQLPGRKCADIGRIVVNDVADCSADDGADLRGQCLAGLATQTRTDIDFGL